MSTVSAPPLDFAVLPLSQVTVAFTVVQFRPPLLAGGARPLSCASCVGDRRLRETGGGGGGGAPIRGLQRRPSKPKPPQELPIVGEAAQSTAIHCGHPADEIPYLEAWFQRPKDIVRKLQSGDLDLGIVSEYGQVNDDLIVVHDALEFEHCRLALAVPKEGVFENINSMEDLAKMPEWSEERPLRVVTGFGYVWPWKL